MHTVRPRHRIGVVPGAPGDLLRHEHEHRGGHMEGQPAHHVPRPQPGPQDAFGFGERRVGDTFFSPDVRLCFCRSNLVTFDQNRQNCVACKIISSYLERVILGWAEKFPLLSTFSSTFFSNAYSPNNVHSTMFSTLTDLRQFGTFIVCWLLLLYSPSWPLRELPSPSGLYAIPLFRPL